MALIAYAVGLRLRQQLDPRQGKTFWGLLLGLGLALFYGLLAGFFFRADTLRHLPPNALPAVRLGLAGALAAVGVLRAFFPTYSPLRDWVRPFHPLGAGPRFALRWALDLVAGYTLCVLVFVATTWLVSDQLGGGGLALLLLAVVIGNALRRLLLTLVAQQRRHGLAALVGTGALLAGAVLLWPAAVAAGYVGPWAVALLLLLLLADFVVEERLPLLDFRATARAGNDLAARSVVWSLLWHNRLARPSLLVGLALKVVFLLYFGAELSGGQKSQVAVSFLLAVYLSPALVTTYLFNNVWGFYPRLWQLLSLSPDQGRAARLLLLRLWLPALAVDFGAGLICVLWRGLPPLLSLGQYAVSAVLLVALSLFWSGWSPQAVTKFYQRSGNTSILAGFATLLLVLLLALPAVSPWFYLGWPLALLLSGWAWRTGTRQFATRRGRVYQTLFV